MELPGADPNKPPVGAGATCVNNFTIDGGNRNHKNETNTTTDKMEIKRCPYRIHFQTNHLLPELELLRMQEPVQVVQMLELCPIT
jgi:hypothetical protein